MTNGEKLKEVFPSIELYEKSHDAIQINFNSVWWNAEYQQPSSSGKPNKSIEEKCPCYHCEYFEIKGWSHCKIHEDAYGDSRCNDYHKVNQGSNKSEIPTSSDCVSRSTVLTLINDVKNANGFSEYSQYEYLFDQVDTMPPATT